MFPSRCAILMGDRAAQASMADAETPARDVWRKRRRSSMIEIINHLSRGDRQTGCLPGVETADQIGDVAEAGSAQDAGGNGAAIAALAVHDHQLFPVQLLCS